MRKSFFILTTLIAGFLLASPVLAALKLSLSPIPEYQKSANFQLYYAYLDTDDNEATVNLYVQKEGGSWRQTQDQDKTEVSGYFQIEDADIYDGEGKYNFYAQAKTASLTENSQTVSVIIDRTNPDKVTNFKKDQVGETSYRLSWTNPDNDDFYRVFIYRSKDKSFTANSSTKVGEAGGVPDEESSFEDSGLEEDTTYYHALRAIDRAGNASDLVTDAPGEVIAGEVTITSEEAEITTDSETGAILLSEEGETTSTTEEGKTEAEEGEKEETVSGEGETAEKTGEVMGEKDTRLFENKLLIIIPLAIVVISAAFIFFKRRTG